MLGNILRVFTANLNTINVPSRVMTAKTYLVQTAGDVDLDGEDYISAEDGVKRWRTYAHLKIISMAGNHMTMLETLHVECRASLAKDVWF